MINRLHYLGPKEGWVPPERIKNVTMTQFSVARHYGGCTFNGEWYVYLPETDELIRRDVYDRIASEEKALQREKEKEKCLRIKAEIDRQMTFFGKEESPHHPDQMS